MSRRKLLDDVTISEIRGMRASGMTNMDIANALGVSYPTVYRVLGRQPSRGGRVAQWIPTESIKRVEPTVQEPQQQEHDGILPVFNRITCLQGKDAVYKVNAKEKTVSISVGDAEIKLEFAAIPGFCDELEAIKRNVTKQVVGPEIW